MHIFTDVDDCALGRGIASVALGAARGILLPMDRRDFLAAGGRTLALAAAPGGLDRLTPLVAPHQLPDDFEARVAAVLRPDACADRLHGAAEWLGQCVSEQGSRLVCWLEVMRALADARPARDCLFVALSGHELGLLGIHAYLQRRPELPRRAQAWIFFGSSIGEPAQPNEIYAADEALDLWLVASLTREGLSVDTRVPRGAAARGEAGIVQQAGGRVVTIACGSDVYHNVADRWPEAVGVASLARYARAMASGAVELAQGHPLWSPRGFRVPRGSRSVVRQRFELRCARCGVASGNCCGYPETS